MPTRPIKLRPKPDFDNPLRHRDYETLEKAKEQAKNHRYAVHELIKGMPVVRLVTKTKFKNLMK